MYVHVCRYDLVIIVFKSWTYLVDLDISSVTGLSLGFLVPIAVGWPRVFGFKLYSDDLVISHKVSIEGQSELSFCSINSRCGANVLQMAGVNARLR